MRQRNQNNKGCNHQVLTDMNSKDALMFATSNVGCSKMSSQSSNESADAESQIFVDFMENDNFATFMNRRRLGLRDLSRDRAKGVPYDDLSDKQRGNLGPDFEDAVQRQLRNHRRSRSSSPSSEQAIDVDSLSQSTDSSIESDDLQEPRNLFPGPLEENGPLPIIGCVVASLLILWWLRDSPPRILWDEFILLFLLIW